MLNRCNWRYISSPKYYFTKIFFHLNLQNFWGTSNINLIRGAIIFSVTRRSRSDVAQSVSESQLADFTDVTLVSEDAAQNSLQMSSSRDLTDVSEARDLTDVSEDAAHNYLQMSSSRDLNNVTLVGEDES